MYGKLQELLDAKGINQYRLSKDTGIPQSTLATWKSYDRVPKAGQLKIIADYFGKPMEYFLEE